MSTNYTGNEESKYMYIYYLLYLLIKMGIIVIGMLPTVPRKWFGSAVCTQRDR